jgi:hypothetical protein
MYKFLLVLVTKLGKAVLIIVARNMHTQLMIKHLRS